MKNQYDLSEFKPIGSLLCAVFSAGRSCGSARKLTVSVCAMNKINIFNADIFQLSVAVIYIATVAKSDARWCKYQERGYFKRLHYRPVRIT